MYTTTASTEVNSGGLTVREQLRVAIRSGNSERIHEATDRWLSGTLRKPELVNDTDVRKGDFQGRSTRFNYSTMSYSGAELAIVPNTETRRGI
jgi:hypothetical protein